MSRRHVWSDTAAGPGVRSAERQASQPEALEVFFAEAQVVADLVANRDLDLLDQLVPVAADLLEVLLEEDHPGEVLRLLRSTSASVRGTPM